jgi:aminopeptidase N/puromycin-sensitive aminopeptidase
MDLPMSPLFFANAGGRGYYRTIYAPADYAALVARAETALTPEERISLTGDEWAQVRANKTTVGNFLNLAAALSIDSNAYVLANSAGDVGDITDEIAATKEERDALAAWIRRVYAPQYAKLAPPAPGDSPNTRELRAHLLSTLAFQGKDANAIAQATRIADQYLSEPASVDPTLGQTALNIAAKYGDTALFDKLQKVYETSSDPELQESALRKLVAFTNPGLLERALEYSVSSKVRNQDSAFQFAIAMRTRVNRDATWNFIKTHWDQVQTEFTPEMGEIFVEGMGNFCSAETRDDVKTFFASHPVPAADAFLRHAVEHINGCIELRQLQEPNLKKWLEAQEP